MPLYLASFKGVVIYSTIIDDHQEVSRGHFTFFLFNSGHFTQFHESLSSSREASKDSDFTSSVDFHETLSFSILYIGIQVYF